MTNEFDLTTLRVESTTETRLEVGEGALLGRGVEFPSGTIVMEWNRDVFAEEDRLENPHQSIYGSRADLEQGAGGEVLEDPDAEPPTTEDPEPVEDSTEEPTEDSEPEPEPAEEPRAYALEIGSTDRTPAMAYTFSVPGEATPEESVEDSDQITAGEDVTTVTGKVGPRGTDAYLIEGLPTSWEAVDAEGKFVAESRFSLRLDGEPVGLEDLLEGGRRTRRVEIEAPGEVAYSLEAEGRIEKVENDTKWSAEPGNDVVEELESGNWRAEGYTGNGYGDAYVVTGEVVDFSPSYGPFSLYLDGEPTTPTALTGGRVEPPEHVIGGGEGYERTVTAEDADDGVADLAGLEGALESAEAGDVVFIEGDAEIYFPQKSDRVTVPAGVTLASNRGVGGSDGALLHTDASYGWGGDALVTLEGGARATGLRVEGPHYGDFWREHTGDYEQSGIKPRGSGVEIDNNEVRGFATLTYTGNDGHVHHNELHHANMQGLGYGCNAGSSEGGLIEFNHFYHNRHSVASSGGGGWEARYNLVDGPALAHVFDVHKPGGTYTHIHHNTVRVVRHDSKNKNAPAVAIRGVPSDKAEIHHNWFFNPKEPRSSPTGGWTDECIIQVHTSRWENVEWYDNHLGESEPENPDVGAPRPSSD